MFNAEYDALPGIGYACGHNLFTTSSIAAFIATAEALRNSGREGRVRLLGTPAEDGGGGKNALDAVVASYVNISLLRQQLAPTLPVHGVIRQGGAEPNIIPDSASLEYFLRGSTFAEVEQPSEKVKACFEAGALATGCQVDCAWPL
ncbi:uncharacterized protein Z519_10086 [Cladophialophora bantiana CBS 173.52]|uniref:Peptidase M20 dimerisation domain-containing protein n=1 Tax=Cladophialophora bantiana (strain ATCC 10958 / CBS 173.52 / CDC B-1940 / NIH 8579) TaxID=1442370 RepID=A0A0D2H7E4_CLAB1|nr:uncharacterized protein Z519_10086 [Cladophialophora bantiana CBS 173.52]KIW89233.1 hypothetical protein Z519_10086 [Cladophialophora bantiana CBS 173.52]